jgi:hypothetical protein
MPAGQTAKVPARQPRIQAQLAQAPAKRDERLAGTGRRGLHRLASTGIRLGGRRRAASPAPTPEQRPTGTGR